MPRPNLHPGTDASGEEWGFIPTGGSSELVAHYFADGHLHSGEPDRGAVRTQTIVLAADRSALSRTGETRAYALSRC